MTVEELLQKLMNLQSLGYGKLDVYLKLPPRENIYKYMAVEEQIQTDFSCVYITPVRTATDPGAPFITLNIQAGDYMPPELRLVGPMNA